MLMQSAAVSSVCHAKQRFYGAILCSSAAGIENVRYWRASLARAITSALHRPADIYCIAVRRIKFDTMFHSSPTDMNFGLLACCRMFDIMSEYNLQLGHPSVCSDLESDAHLLELLRRQPTNVLRYTTAVDILAPVFDMTFFQDSVVQTLKNATYGQL